MNLSITKYLILGAIVLNLIVIFGTRKFKVYNPIINADAHYKIEGIKLLKNIWKRQIIIVAIGITLFFLSILIKDNSSTLAIKTFIFISNLYVFISVILGTYNYNSFNRKIVNLLEKINK